MSRNRIVDLTDEQIALLQTSLDHLEAAIRDTGYDPQVQEWARTHQTETERKVAAVRRALASSAGSERAESPPEADAT